MVGEYFDQHVLARQQGETCGRFLGEQIGFQQGREAGYGAGHDDGYAEGHSIGYQQGWDEGVARSNQEILKQMDFTRQHIADKEAMAQELQDQRQLIAQLTMQLNGNAKAGLEGVVTAQEVANERLQAEVLQLNEKVLTLTREYTDQVWQYNRNMVLMNAMRSTLEVLTTDSGSQAKQVREVFAQRYGEHVSKALRKGTIRVAPDKDNSFAMALPNTQRFILDMLAAVAPNMLKDVRAQEMA